MLRQPGLQCDVAVDERSAAFFALGIAKASRRPVLVLATSGTAPANWLPAVIEASQAGAPLTPMDALAVQWIAEHPEYADDLADVDAAFWVADGQHYTGSHWWGSNLENTGKVLRRQLQEMHQERS